jgi:hypothetical protein
VPSAEKIESAMLELASY